jgi:hypothetical protein
MVVCSIFDRIFFVCVDRRCSRWATIGSSMANCMEAHPRRGAGAVTSRRRRCAFSRRGGGDASSTTSGREVTATTSFRRGDEKRSGGPSQRWRQQEYRQGLNQGSTILDLSSMFFYFQNRFFGIGSLKQPTLEIECLVSVNDNRYHFVSYKSYCFLEPTLKTGF